MKKIIVSIIIVLFLCGLSFSGTTETSGITAQTIITNVKRTINSESDPLYDDNDFIQWIDEAVRETVNRTDCLETTRISKTLVANTYVYDPGQSFLRVVAVFYDNGDTTDDQQVRTLDRVHINDIGHNDATGDPQIYAVWNDQVEIWPIPRTTQDGNSIYIYTVPLPTGVSATSSAIETPAYLDTALTYYVIAMAYFKDDRPDKAKTFLDLWEKRLAEYKAIVVRQTPIE